MSDDAPRPYTFLLKLTDRPGGMESVAATFSHRGVSITSTLGNDGALDPEGRATVLVTFTAAPARKEALRNALRRLSRVVAVAERGPEDAGVRKCALVRLAPGSPAPAFPPGAGGGTVEPVADEEDACRLFALLGPPDAVDALVEAARAAGRLRAVTYATVAL